MGLHGGIEADLCLSDLAGVTRVAPEDAGQSFRIRRSEVGPGGGFPAARTPGSATGHSRHPPFPVSDRIIAAPVAALWS